MRARLRRFFDDGDGGAVGAEFDHAIGFRVAHLIGKDRSARARRRRPPEQGRKSVAVEDIVPQNQRDMVAVDKASPDDECLRQPLGSGLFGIANRKAPLPAVTQQTGETGQFRRRRDDQNVPDARQHQGRQRIIHHRLVVDRQQLLAERQGGRVEAGAVTAGQNDPLHPLSAPISSRTTAGRLDRHRGGEMPSAATLRQSSTEFIGRCAAVGY